MRALSSKKFKFSKEHEQELQNLVVDENGPGSILHDFELFLRYVKENELPITGTQQPKMSALPKINQLFRHPIELGLKRPQLKSYPNIQALLLLLRATALTRVKADGKKPLFVVYEDIYKAWENLNPSERYGVLLETWLLYIKPEVIGEDRFLPFFSSPFSACINLFEKTPANGLKVSGNSEVESWFRYRIPLYSVALMELFGLITIKHGTPLAGEGWRIKLIQRTRFGDALLALFQTKILADIEKILKRLDEGSFGVLQPVLKPYLPQWDHYLPLPQLEFRKGTHILKVSLGGVWGRIVISADSPLDTLAHTILEMVDFDSDHLYQFSYRNPFGVQEKINHPYMDEELSTSEVLVGEVPIDVGQSMTYLFDFGDNWTFDVTLERIDPDSVVKEPQLLEVHGTPPNSTQCGMIRLVSEKQQVP